MITKYIKELNKFLFVSSSAVSALEQTKQGSDDVVKELEHLKAKEEKYSKNSQDYKRFDLSKMVVNMKEILGKSPQSFSSIVRCFHQDLLLCQGVLQAIEFRKNLATRLKKALKVEEHWKAKPPTTPQAKQKRQKHQKTLGHLSAALDITDKLLIEVHLPGIFKDMQHRFGIAAKRVIKDHLALTRRMISFWKTTQEELGCF
uniref:Uncharacterized protein n=1 Tax=Amorphochlora amoebiformis TaxID=1561963 RepID=A0A7S0DRQ0_9EUKA|mmetsp:Transcript_7454/g.11527  ORF Transcript_7454/g.11527 Transcript_7454/m.11527 type:complete len:202 (+) Transcript_7454:1-606(+)